MRRLVPLVAILLIAACSKEPAEASASEGAAQAAGQEVGAKPVPAQLPDVIARVNGEDISRAEFERALQNMEARAGGPVPADQRDRIYRELLDQLIGYTLLTQETQSRKVAVPDADVEERIGQIKAQFPSEAVFEQMLKERNVSVDQMRADARQDMAIAKMLTEEVDAKVTVAPDQVNDFYAKNPDQFKEPERVRASHILIAFPENADADAKAEARKKAEQVLGEVKAGGDFAALAKQHSQDPGSAVNGGDLGFFEQGQMVGPFNDAAFSLPAGTTSELVETNFGYHIIRVAEKLAGRTVPLDEVRPQVEEYLRNVNRDEQTEAFVDALRARGKIEVFI